MKDRFTIGSLKNIQVSAARDGRGVRLRIDRSLTGREQATLIRYIVEHLIVGKIATNDTHTIISFSPIPHKPPYIDLCEVAARGLDELFPPQGGRCKSGPKPRELTPAELRLRQLTAEQRILKKELRKKLGELTNTLPYVQQAEWNKLGLYNKFIGELVVLTSDNLEGWGAKPGTIKKIERALKSRGLHLGMDTLGWRVPYGPRKKL